MKHAAPRHLVIGAVRGYSYDQLKPFVVSLRRSGFDGEVVLCWNHLERATRDALSAQGVTLEPFDYRGSGSHNSWSRFWPIVRPFAMLPLGRRVRRIIYCQILNLAFVRYLHILKYLEARRDRFLNVLVTDVRDVLFQDNPFRDALPGEIAAYLEDSSLRFGSDPLNSGWLEENYGRALLQRFDGVRISCCGTVMGSIDGMILYLRAFVEEIRCLKSVAHGADTSVHNVLIRERLRSKCVLVENMEGAVATIGTTPSERLRCDETGRIVDSRRRAVPILHQHDRHERLAAKLEQIFVGDSR